MQQCWINNCIATSKSYSVCECILRRPAVACLPPLPLAAIVPLCSAAAATVRHVRTALCARTTTYLSGTCADRNAAQVPAAAEQRSSLPSFEAPPSSAARTNSKQHKSMQKQTVAVATKKQHCAPRFPQTLTLNPKGCAKKTQASSRLRTAPFDSSMRARSGQIHGQSAFLNYCVKHDTAEGFPRCTQSALLFNPHRALGGRQYPSGSLPPPQAPYAAGGACYS